MSLLNEAASLGIINLAYLQEQVAMKKHSFKIWQGSNGYWYTYVADDTKGRRLIKKKSEADIQKAIAASQNKASLTFMSVYHEWRSYQDLLVDENSVAKYNTDEKRYFTDEKFFMKRVSSYIEEDLLVYIKKRVEEDKLCKSACKTFVGDIKRVFDFAQRKGYISQSPMAFVTPKEFYKYCVPSNRSKKSQVIESEDLTQLRLIFEEDYIKQPWYMPTYAVELASLTGMRVGELAALRWDHMYKDYILVDSSEKYKRISKSFAVENTKNEKIRKFPRTAEINEVLKRVKSAQETYIGMSEWVFADKNGRIHAHVISSCLKNKCKMLGITERGIHAYRKTLNSAMRAEGVSSAVAASLIGNSIEVNDKYYTYDVTSMDEKNRIISAVNAKMMQQNDE